MSRKIWRVLLAVCLLVSMTMTAYAETSYGKSDWSVTFTSEKKMVSNFKTADLDEAIYGIQPGDNVFITLTLTNEHNTAADWYMTNEVLYSLEDRSANSDTGGGAYTYKLTYTNPGGTETVLFDSDTVGGENASGAGEGLHQATDALEDYFFLDTLKKGQSGKIVLEVALDGDTQGNDYQNTLADLQMNFAVELNTSGTNTPNVSNPGTRRNIVRTGDEMTLTPFIIIACVSGILLLLLTVYFHMENKKASKRPGRILLVLLLSFCVAGSFSSTAFAAKNEKTTYTVRLFAGAHSTLANGGEMMSYEVEYNSPLPFSTRDVKEPEGEDSKYYVKDIRESGKDNKETLEAGYRVREDKDYVVAYGIFGDRTSYTVQFQTEDGTNLAPPETYYGNVGDNPVVAFLYIDGYLPQAYNLMLEGGLKSDPAVNVFTFVYTPVSAEAAAAGAEAAASAGGTMTTTAAGAGAAGVGAAGAGAADAAAAAAAAEAEGVTPDDLQTIPDDETPLANPDGNDEAGLRSVEDEKTPLGRGDFATVLWNIPLAGKIGILSVLALVCAGGGYLYLRRKRKMKNA